MTLTFDLWQVYNAGPVMWGSIEDTTSFGFVYQGVPYLTKNEPSPFVAHRYDVSGRLVETAINPQGTTVVYNYDHCGNRTSVVTTQGLGGL